MTKCAFFLLTVLALATAVFPNHSGRASIVLHPESFVVTDQVFLGDVSEIRASELIRSRLARLSLGRSPAIGSFRSLSLRRIRLVIAAAGFSLSEIDIKMRGKAFVQRRGQTLDKSEIETKIRADIKDRFGGNIEILISTLEIPDLGQVPLGDVEYRSSFEGIRNPFSRFSLPVRVFVNKKMVRKLSVQVDLDAFAEVLTVEEDIAPNTLLKKSMFRTEKLRIDRPLTYYFTNASELNGTKSAKPIRKNDPLRRSSTVKAIVIRNGDNVRIEAVSKTFKLLASGTALGPGRIGEMIAVKNNESGRIFKALILDKGLVRVNF